MKDHLPRDTISFKGGYLHVAMFSVCTYLITNLCPCDMPCRKKNKLGVLYTNTLLMTVNPINFYTDQVVSVVENGQLKSAGGNVLLGYRIA